MHIHVELCVYVTGHVEHTYYKLLIYLSYGPPSINTTCFCVFIMGTGRVRRVG